MNQNILASIPQLDPHDYPKIISVAYNNVFPSNSENILIKKIKYLYSEEIDPYNELILTYIAGNMRIDPKVIGYYIEKSDPHMYINMVMERIEGEKLSNIKMTPFVFNEIRRLVEVLYENHIRITLDPENIIINDNEDIIIVNYSKAVFQRPGLKDLYMLRYSRHWLKKRLQNTN